jgi:hypothetical protein
MREWNDEQALWMAAAANRHTEYATRSQPRLQPGMYTHSHTSL